MKNVKKILALVVALMMVLAMGTIAFASGDVDPEPTATTGGSITITPPANVDSAATNTYKIYKVFDAVPSADGSKVSYKLVAGKTTVPAGFEVDTAGNVTYAGTEGATDLTDADIAAIAAYVANDTPIATVTSTGTADAVASGLPSGYYYITTSTGTLVTINTAKPDAKVIDKNTVPSVDKKITGATSMDENGKKALAQVGTTVSYSAEITVGDGAKGYVFHDTMETGLTYNNDAAVTGVEAGSTTYTVGKEDTDTFTITFNDDYIKTLKAGDKLTVTYSATVNDDAITVDPLKNTAYLNYGDKNSNNKTPVTEAEVYEAKITVTKQDGDEKPLAGAGFVIKNAEGKYYKIANKVVSWVDSIDDATEYTSDDAGAVPAFTGLANGTYTLIEKTVPEGYNKAADQNFTIAEHDYTAANLEQTATVTNEAGSVLPSTGGIGTTIFYVGGSILVLAAVVLLVTKRRMSVGE